VTKSYSSEVLPCFTPWHYGCHKLACWVEPIIAPGLIGARQLGERFIISNGIEQPRASHVHEIRDPRRLIDNSKEIIGPNCQTRNESSASSCWQLNFVTNRCKGMGPINMAFTPEIFVYTTLRASTPRGTSSLRLCPLCPKR